MINSPRSSCYEVSKRVAGMASYAILTDEALSEIKKALDLLENLSLQIERGKVSPNKEMLFRKRREVTLDWSNLKAIAMKGSEIGNLPSMRIRMEVCKRAEMFGHKAEELTRVSNAAISVQQRLQKNSRKIARRLQTVRLLAQEVDDQLMKSGNVFQENRPVVSLEKKEEGALQYVIDCATGTEPIPKGANDIVELVRKRSSPENRPSSLPHVDPIGSEFIPSMQSPLNRILVSVNSDKIIPSHWDEAAALFMTPDKPSRLQVPLENYLKSGLTPPRSPSPEPRSLCLGDGSPGPASEASTSPEKRLSKTERASLSQEPHAEYGSIAPPKESSSPPESAGHLFETMSTEVADLEQNISDLVGELKKNREARGGALFKAAFEHAARRYLELNRYLSEKKSAVANWETAYKDARDQFVRREDIENLAHLGFQVDSMDSFRIRVEEAVVRIPRWKEKCKAFSESLSRLRSKLSFAFFVLARVEGKAKWYERFSWCAGDSYLEAALEDIREGSLRPLD